MATCKQPADTYGMNNYAVSAYEGQTSLLSEGEGSQQLLVKALFTSKS